MFFRINKEEAPVASQEAIGENKFVGDVTPNTVDLDAEHAVAGRRVARPETEIDRFECEAEMEAFRDTADVLHAARDAIGSNKPDAAMESFLIDTGLCDPYSAENFSVENFSFSAEAASALPAALDKAIAHAEGEVRHLRNLML